MKGSWAGLAHPTVNAKRWPPPSVGNEHYDQLMLGPLRDPPVARLAGVRPAYSIAPCVWSATRHGQRVSVLSNDTYPLRPSYARQGLFVYHALVPAHALQEIVAGDEGQEVC